MEKKMKRLGTVAVARLVRLLSSFVFGTQLSQLQPEIITWPKRAQELHVMKLASYGYRFRC